jgi:type II secretory pathway component PulM
MSARLKALWLARTPRERWLLAIMFALAALVLIWFLLLRPLGDMLSAARERHGLAVAGLSEARARAAAIATL